MRLALSPGSLIPGVRCLCLILDFAAVLSCSVCFACDLPGAGSTLLLLVSRICGSTISLPAPFSKPLSCSVYAAFACFRTSRQYQLASKAPLKASLRPGVRCFCLLKTIAAVIHPADTCYNEFIDHIWLFRGDSG